MTSGLQRVRIGRELDPSENRFFDALAFGFKVNRNPAWVKGDFPGIRRRLSPGQPGVSLQQVHSRGSWYQHAVPSRFLLNELRNRLLRVLVQLQIKPADIESIQILTVVVAMAISIFRVIFFGPSAEIGI